MRSFRYQAVDYSGRKSRGVRQAATRETALRDLELKGLYVVSMSEGAGRFSRVGLLWRELRIGPADMLEFTRNLSVLLDSGMPMLGSLDDIIASTGNPAFIPVLLDLRLRLEQGSSVSLALEAHGALFPELLRTLVAVGEETGSLAASLREASEHLQRMETLRASVKKALMYPAFAFFATLGALVFWLVFVIPGLSSTLKTMGVGLPLLTRVLIEASALTRAHWRLGILILGLALPALFLIDKLPRVRYLRDLALIKTPLLKLVTFNRLLATFAEQFGILIGAGIGMARIFDLMTPALGNAYFTVQLRAVKESILSGGRISDSFERQGVLPALVLSKIRVGETTGTLDQQFEFLAGYYRKRLDDAVENLGKIIEPVVLVVIGALFALIIMGLLLPIYNLVSKVGRT